ncbi:MAG: hypothetical protein ACR2HO_09405 [Rubrobacteraceae bacterium]
MPADEKVRMPSSIISLPFWIPQSFSVVDGIARVCETELVVEFEIQESMFRMGTKEVAIPFEEIESVVLKRGLLKNMLLFTTKRMHPASSIPRSRAGQFALRVSREHTKKAKEVESLLAYELARRDLRSMSISRAPATPGSPGPQRPHIERSR